MYAFIPSVDQTPFIFEPIGRKVATEHEQAEIRIAPLSANQQFKATTLPVAAMIKSENEIWAAFRTKRRPCLVLGVEKAEVDDSLTRKKPKHATAPMYLVAPYYGVKGKEGRAGYSEEFVERVRHCEYPQFFWDFLPIPSGEESILRLDHLQPIGAHHKSYKVLPYRLSDEALSLLDDVLRWLVWGGVPEDSMLLDYKAMISKTFGD